MQSHAALGAETLREIAQEHGQGLAFLQMAVDITRHHHERWDGSGYPRGLKGAEIPQGARILAVVDAYESMTRGRPYRPPVARESAMEELRNEAGKHFDPDTVREFIRVLEREEGAS